MSETMTTGEIEDVLSSIRRLVSEDLRPAPRPVQATLVSDDSARPVDKLILTPALRIVPPAEAPAAPRAVAPAEPLILTTPVVEAPAEEITPDTIPDTAEPVAPAPEVPEAPAAEMTAMPEVAAVPADPWADDGTAEDTQSWPGEPTKGADRPEPVRFEGWPPAEGQEGWPSDPPEVVPEAGARPEDVVVTIGAALQGQAEWEPETGDTSPVTRLSWIEVADRAEEDVDASPPPHFVHRTEARIDAQARKAAEEPALIGTTEDVLDEAVLREIVRAVLREELQGHLGERITRNIRKLVRAEINRSLTLRDYE